MIKHTADEHQDIRDAVRALCAEFPDEYHRKVDEKRGYPEEFVDALTKAGWLAAKFITFGGAVILGLLLRAVIRDWVKGFAQLRNPATEADGNLLIGSAHHRARNLALLLWLLVALTAFFGVTKPGLGLS